MPIHIYHGNGLTAISKVISDLKSRFEGVAITEINGKSTSFGDIKMTIGTGGLFADSRLVLIDNIPEPTDLTGLTSDASTTVVFRFNKKVPVTTTFLKSAKQIKADVREFSEADEISIFPFLDMLGEQKQTAFAEFEKVYAQYGGQYILTMMYYFFRRMIAAPKKGGSAFMAQKVEHQKQNFSVEKIKELYRNTLETDFEIKSGLREEKLGLTMIVEKVLEH